MQDDSSHMHTHPCRNYSESEAADLKGWAKWSFQVAVFRDVFLSVGIMASLVTAELGWLVAAASLPVGSC